MRLTIKLFCVLSLLGVTQAALGAAAVRLVLSNDFCLIQPCGPHSPPPRDVVAGALFGIYVVALDGEGSRDNNYAGTVHFSSTDPLATLPSDYTFLPEDQGDRAFTAILRTPGDQTITVIDLGGNLISGTLVMTVNGPAPAESVPTMSGWARILLLMALASVGVWLARLRS